MEIKNEVNNTNEGGRSSSSSGSSWEKVNGGSDGKGSPSSPTEAKEFTNEQKTKANPIKGTQTYANEEKSEGICDGESQSLLERTVHKLNCFKSAKSEEIPLMPKKEAAMMVTDAELAKARDALKPASSMESAKGLLLAFLGAGVMYGLTGVLVRMAGQSGVGAMQVLFARSVFQTLVYSVLLKCNSLPVLPPSDRYKRCIAIAIIYAIATLTSYEAFNLIPPGSAIATRGAVRTIFAIILAYFIAKERIHTSDFVVIVFCIGGIAMIISSGVISGNTVYVLSPGITDDPTKILIFGFVLIICAGVTRSLGLTLVRIIKDEVPALAIVLYHSSLTLIITSILVATIRQPSEWPPSKEGIGYTLGVCCTSAVATWSSNRAVYFVHPALVSLGQNADIFVSITFQHILLQMPPHVLEITGALCIAVAISGLTIHKYRNRHKNAHQELHNEDSE